MERSCNGKGLERGGGRGLGIHEPLLGRKSEIYFKQTKVN